MRTTRKFSESLRFAGGRFSGRLKGNMVTLGAALVALLSGNSPVAALQSSASVSPATMPPIATIDDRFESYNVEMAEVIGGKFWKPPCAHPKPGIRMRSGMHIPAETKSGC